jgi:hypothetical protein
MTVTLTVLAACAGAVTCSELAEIHVTFVANAVPNLAVAPETNPVPFTVTVWVKFAGPVGGATDVTVGAGLYVKPFTSVPACVSGFVTITFTTPLPAGAVAVIVVAFTTATPVAEFGPNFTVAPLTKAVPVIVTGQLPASGPAFGVTEDIVGGAMKVYAFVSVALPPGVVAITLNVPAALVS